LTQYFLGRQSISGLVLAFKDSVLQVDGNDLKKAPVLDRGKMVLGEKLLAGHGIFGLVEFRIVLP